MATAAQWQQGGPSLAQAERGTRAGVNLPTRHRGPSDDAATLGSPVLLPPRRAQRRQSVAGSARTPRKLGIEDANGVARSRRSFPPMRNPFRTTQTEVNTRIDTRPRRARWSASDRSPQGEPALPATRHLQVERDWCPVTFTAQADSDGYGLRMVRNTYRKRETPCAT